MDSVEAAISARLDAQMAPLFKKNQNHLRTSTLNIGTQRLNIKSQRELFTTKNSFINLDGKSQTIVQGDKPIIGILSPRKQSMRIDHKKIETIASFDSIDRPQHNIAFLKLPSQVTPNATIGSVTSFHDLISPFQGQTMPSSIVDSKRTIVNDLCRLVFIRS